MVLASFSRVPLALTQRRATIAAAQTLALGALNARSAVSCAGGSVRLFSSSAGKDKILDQARKWQRQRPEEKAKVLSVQIDRSELKQAGAYPGRIASEEMLSKKSKENDLVQVIRTMIEVKGPLTVSEFMQRVCIALCPPLGMAPDLINEANAWIRL